MRAVIISGARNPQGQTAQATSAFVDGLRERGWTSDLIFLPERQIQRCEQCDDDGWGICRTEGRCTIEDDFPSIVEAIGTADLVVFATPVYFGDLSESLRALLDRLRRITRHESAKTALEDKPAVGICVAGGGGGGAPSCAVSLEHALGPCGFDTIDLIPVRRQNLDLKRDVLRTTGRWAADLLAAHTDG